MRILPSFKTPPAVIPAEAGRIVNVNKIASSIEKAHNVLKNLKATRKPNREAIATWERIIAALQSQWRNAMVEVASNGRYSFE